MERLELLKKAVEMLDRNDLEGVRNALQAYEERAMQEQSLGGVRSQEPSLGERVVKELGDWLQAAATLQSAGLGRSPSVEAKNITTTVAAALRSAFRPGIFATAYERLLGVVPLLTVIPVTNDLVEYASGSFTVNAANPILEGDPKTQVSTPSFTLNQVPVRTIAAWVPVTKQALADIPQLQVIINTYLLYQLGHRLEQQVINGNGTAPQMRGILNTSGIFTITVAAADPVINNLLAVRRIRQSVEGAGYTPTAVALNPTDWAEIELLRDNNGMFYYGGPAIQTQPTLWGMRVVLSAEVPAGRAIVGDWRYAVLFDRDQGNIAIADQHADYFVRNIVAVLAEMRAGFAVTHPTAFGAVTFRSWT